MNFLRRIVSGVDDDVVGRPHTSFSLASLSRLGLKGDAICVAFDPVQTLLAIGISNGDILLVGKGWEKVLSVPTSSAPPPRYLAFKFGQPYLIAVSTENELSVWDIQTGKVQVEPVSVSSSNVTAVAAPAGGKYVYLGLSNGDVVVYDCTTGIQSPYHITCSLSLEEAAIGGKAVLSVEFNPKDAALLLIGHTAGFSTLWHTTEQVVKKRFRIEQGKNYTPVCTMGWHPEGQHVIAIAGPRIFIWDTKDTWLDGFKRPSAIKPWRSLPLSLDSNLIQVASGAPARRIWHCEKRGGTDEECRIVSTIACGPEEGLETLSWVTLPPLDKIKEDTKLDTGVIVVAPIASFVVVPHIKSTTGGSPAVFSISLMGDINFSTLADGEGVALSLPGSLQLASSPEISDFAASDCSEAFGWDIRNSISKPSTSPSFSNYIQAGTVINKNAKHLWDIFCTLHTDRIVRFWQVGVPVPHHLFDYEITGSPRSDDGRVTLDASQRSFVVVEGHELVLYRWMTAAEVEAALEPEEDMDELMNRLDATVDDVLRQAGDLQALAKAHHGNEPSPTDDDIPPPLLPPRDPSPPPPLPPRDPSPLNSHDSINQDEPLPPYSIDASTAAQQETRVPSYTGNNSTVHISDAELEENVWGDATSSNNTHRVPVVASSSNNDSWDQQSKASGSKTHGDPSSSVSSSSGKQQPSARPPTPSAEPPPLPSGNDEDHSALLDSPTFAAPVRLEYMAPNLVSQKGGWQPILKFHHHGNVTKHALASWTNLLVTAADGGLHLIHLVSGEVTSTIAPNDVASLHVAETYMEKEEGLRICVFLATDKGAHFAYSVRLDDHSQQFLVQPPLQVFSPMESRSERPIMMAVLDDHGRVIHQQSSRAAGEHYLVLVLAESIVILVAENNKKNEIVASYRARSNLVTIVQAGISIVNGDPVLVVITSAGTVQTFELPGLKLLWEESLPITASSALLHKTHISRDGKLLLWTRQNEFEVFSIASNTSELPDVDIRMYDLTKAMAWTRERGIRPSTVKSPAEDALFSNPAPSQGRTVASSSSSSRETAARISEGGPFSRTKQALGERGEKLGILEHKFGDLEDTSKGFLDNIKEYNKRQAAKKWYQI